MPIQKKLQWGPVAMMIVLFAIIAFVTNLCSQMATIVQNECNASEFATQIGFFAVYYAYAVMGIPSSILVSRFGYRRTAIVALIVGMSGLSLTFLSGVFSDYWVYLIGVFVCGMCMCMLNAVVNPVLNMLGGGGKGGNQLLQTGNAFNSAAAVGVFILMGSLVPDQSHATISDAMPSLVVAGCLFVVVFIALLFSNLPETTRKTIVPSDVVGALRYRHFTLGAVSVFFYMGLEIGVPTYITYYLPQLGYSEVLAFQVSGCYWLMMFVGRIFGGMFGSVISSRAMVSIASVGCIILLLFGIMVPQQEMTAVPCIDWANLVVTFVDMPVSILAFVFVGLFTSVMWGGIYNIAVEGLGQYTVAATGIFMTTVCGCAVMLGVQGIVADSTSIIQSYWVPLSCAAFILIYTLFGSRPNYRGG